MRAFALFATFAALAGASLPAAAQTATSHPLMTPEALAQAEANFDRCLQGLWPEAQRRGVTRQTWERELRGIEPDMGIMQLMDNQPEFERPIWWYLDRLVNDTRIETGRELLAKWKTTFDAVEKKWGVDRFLLTAIWGIESNFGSREVLRGRDVVRSTATLSCIGRRQDFFRGEFLASLLILQKGDVARDDMRGSWAGAFGQTQFMPTGYLQYAVDLSGDGQANLVENIPDVLASTANRFRNENWVTGQTWGYEVVVPPGFNYLLADRGRRMSIREWEALGLKRVAGRAFPRATDQAFLLLPAGARGPGFLMLDNFRVIMRYNPAESYALAIGHLADRLRGGGPITQPWPRDAQLLTRPQRFELQQLLIGRGFDIGEPDGKIGSKTRDALRQVQAQLGLVPDGFATADVLARLRR